MSEISELERRISAALDRIGSALDRVGGGGDAELAAALEAERTANAQLEARVAAIKVKQETQVAALNGEVERLKTALLERDGEIQALRGVNADLRVSNSALREANAKGVGDATLINSAMAAELKALRTASAAARAEVDEVLAVLEPLLEEAGNA